MLRCCIILLLMCIDSVQQKTVVLNTCIYCCIALTVLVLITQDYSFQHERYYKFSDFHSKCYSNDGIVDFYIV